MLRVLLSVVLAIAANTAAAQAPLPTCSNTGQSPDSTVNPVTIGTVVTLTVDTVNAVRVEIDTVPLAPDVDPLANTNVTWTATHTAISDVTLTALAFNADDVSTSCSWDIDLVDPPPPPPPPAPVVAAPVPAIAPWSLAILVLVLSLVGAYRSRR